MPIFHLGLIGYPLEHSLSPKIHTTALSACGLKGDYSLFSIHPDDKQGLKDLLTRVRSGDITGLNVTIPHKQNVIPFVDDLTPTAKSIGALNTIYFRHNKLIGDNTDAAGFLADLKKFLTTETRRHGDAHVLVLGAGGSARAVVYALFNDGWNVKIAARKIEQAQQLAASIASDQLPITKIENLQSQVSNLHLIVNTTPLGMSPNVNQSPLPENLSLPRHVSIYDLIYNPRETKLVRDARSLGLNATTGLGMLIEQAALSFEIWTGHRPSREVMRASVEQSPVSNH
ncbi:MAG: shikimate dehydrogenase [Anaerolineae bacterium]|nr:shikimate dehydrogenase [Anaerolineae bacterium]MCI0609959.1 shikimate dehydrogenase [Anaerolineae bacterium]